VENGADAISKVREGTCEVIFLDVIMPLLVGYEVGKILKSNPKTKAIPVIMLTSNDGFFDKIRGKKAGADIYLTKPVKYDEIVKSLKKYFPDIKESQS
jgi:twitching motility two-component system response regulator PilG